MCAFIARLLKSLEYVLVGQFGAKEGWTLRTVSRKFFWRHFFPWQASFVKEFWMSNGHVIIVPSISWTLSLFGHICICLNIGYVYNIYIYIYIYYNICIDDYRCHTCTLSVFSRLKSFKRSPCTRTSQRRRWPPCPSSAGPCMTRRRTASTGSFLGRIAPKLSWEMMDFCIFVIFYWDTRLGYIRW